MSLFLFQPFLFHTFNLSCLHQFSFLLSLIRPSQTLVFLSLAHPFPPFKHLSPSSSRSISPVFIFTFFSTRFPLSPPLQFLFSLSSTQLSFLSSLILNVSFLSSYPPSQFLSSQICLLFLSSYFIHSLYTIFSSPSPLKLVSGWTN